VGWPFELYKVYKYVTYTHSSTDNIRDLIRAEIPGIASHYELPWTVHNAIHICNHSIFSNWLYPLIESRNGTVSGYFVRLCKTRHLWWCPCPSPARRGWPLSIYSDPWWWTENQHWRSNISMLFKSRSLRSMNTPAVHRSLARRDIKPPPHHKGGWGWGIDLTAPFNIWSI
jgi:hypothetical protein